MSDYITDQRVPLPTSMTLRDYFAAQAMTIGLRNFCYANYENGIRISEPDAKWCYDVADAMMQARKME